MLKLTWSRSITVTESRVGVGAGLGTYLLDTYRNRLIGVDYGVTTGLGWKF
jgi:hypothetical protein